MRRFATVVVVMMVLLIAVAANAEDQNVTSKFGVKVYGFLKFETIYDNSEIYRGDWQLFAWPDDNAAYDHSVFTMNARHSRLGFDFTAPNLTSGTRVTGKLEVDFAGGFANSKTAPRQPLLRLRHAWVQLANGNWEARFGQDWALISGPFPYSTNFVVGAGAGNLWMRFPQMRFTYKMDQFKFAVSLNRPMAGNTLYDNAAGGSFDPVLGGERTGMPWVMGRVYADFGNVDVSVSGHYGTENVVDATNNIDDDTPTFSMNADAVMDFGPLDVTVRGFMGENLTSFFGGVFQGYAIVGSDIENVASMGGWGQLKYTLNDNWALCAGYGFDDPEDDYTTRTKNEWIWGNATWTLSPAVQFMLEVDQMNTEYAHGTDDGSNTRFQFVSYYKF